MPYEQSESQAVVHSKSTKAVLREEIVVGYRAGKYTAAECFDAFDKHSLWPPGKSVFWEIFVDGLLLYLNKKADQDPPQPPPFSGAPAAPLPSYRREVA